MGASARRKRRGGRGPRAPGTPAQPSLPGRRPRAGVGGRIFLARNRSSAESAFPKAAARVCFAERAVVFVLCAGERRFGVGRACSSSSRWSLSGVALL